VYRINLIIAVMFLCVFCKADTRFENLRTEFNKIKIRLLHYNFKPDGAQKKFAAELAQMQELHDQARALYRIEEKNLNSESPLTLSMHQMSLDLSFLEQLDVPVASGFNAEACREAVKTNDAAKVTNQDLYKEVKAFLEEKCPK
jgi:hypothetical protein